MFLLYVCQNDGARLPITKAAYLSRTRREVRLPNLHAIVSQPQVMIIWTNACRALSILKSISLKHITVAGCPWLVSWCPGLAWVEQTPHVCLPLLVLGWQCPVCRNVSLTGVYPPAGRISGSVWQFIVGVEIIR